MIELGLSLREMDVAALRETARTAESAGYASLGVPDHLADGQAGPLVACAVLAEATERARIGTLVLNNDFRHPVVLAREVATLADLCGGRFELGLGAGHMAREYANAGLPFDPPDQRIGRLDESVQILRALLAGQVATIDGAHYAVQNEQIRPAPGHDVPILIGGNSRRLLEVAATRADIVGLAGFSERRGGAGPQDLSMFATAAVATQVERISREAAAHGRCPRFQALVQWGQITPNRGRVAESIATEFGVSVETVLDSPYVLLGTADEILTQIREHEDRLGITRWTLFAHHPGGQPPCIATFAPIAEALATT